MPRYDYRCESCNDEFELKQTFAEAGTGTCPSCSGAGRRVIHAVPVIYKGSGFYTTDYGRPKQPSDDKNGGDGSTSADSKSSDSKASDSKSSDSKSSDSKSSDSKSSGDSKSDTAAKSTSDSSSKSSSGSGSAVSTSADSS